MIKYEFLRFSKSYSYGYQLVLLAFGRVAGCVMVRKPASGDDNWSDRPAKHAAQNDQRQIANRSPRY